jgi:hypothetical protein
MVCTLTPKRDAFAVSTWKLITGYSSRIKLSTCSSHEISLHARELIQQVALDAGANYAVVEMPPGPPVLRPVVAEVYGPDKAKCIFKTNCGYIKTTHCHC